MDNEIGYSPLLIALASGILPALLWLWFWLHEDRLHPEPRRQIALAFLAGMLAVPLAYYIQKFFRSFLAPTFILTLVWAATEEISKFLLAYVIVLRSKFTDEPIDMVIYMITTALGFAALENTLFMLTPFSEGNMLGGIVTGNLRFMGATLLHIVASGTVGIALAFSFYKGKMSKTCALIFGLILSSALHTVFNLFIMKAEEGNDAFIIFAGVWFAIVVLIVMFEKIKTITPAQA